eukprot:1526164-Prymnesium_polylepis.1
MFTVAALLSTGLVTPRMSVVPQPAPARGVDPMAAGELALGFDFGTSGARCALVDAEGNLVCSPPPYPWGERERRQTAADWEEALHSLLESVPEEERRRVSRIAVSGTSSSVLLCDETTGAAASDRGCRMYDFNVVKQAAESSGEDAMALIRSVAPDDHTVRSPTSALAKVIAWHCESPLQPNEKIAHQADFIANRLCGGGPIVSDWHNSLKASSHHRVSPWALIDRSVRVSAASHLSVAQLGFDVAALGFPSWMESGELGDVLNGRLPRVVMPGGLLGNLSPELAERLGMPEGAPPPSKRSEILQGGRRHDRLDRCIHRIGRSRHRRCCHLARLDAGDQAALGDARHRRITRDLFAQARHPLWFAYPWARPHGGSSDPRRILVPPPAGWAICGSWAARRTRVALCFASRWVALGQPVCARQSCAAATNARCANPMASKHERAHAGLTSERRRDQHAHVRRQGFTSDELVQLSTAIDPAQPPLHTNYYPLPAATVGERFPRADDGAVGVLEPVPEERSEFLHAILHGLGRVEAEGYSALKELGASELRRVLTCGGGAENPQWTQLREKMLEVPTSRAPQTDAALGAALLARG